MKILEVAELFVSGEEGKVKHLFIEGNVIYSYGYHFPIAIRLESDNGYKYLFNCSSYSNSTAKHKYYVLRQIGEENILFKWNTNKLKDVINLNVKSVKELMLHNLEAEQ